MRRTSCGAAVALGGKMPKKLGLVTLGSKRRTKTQTKTCRLHPKHPGPSVRARGRDMASTAPHAA